MVEQPTEVVVRVDAGPDGDEEEVAELALRLRDELREVDGAASVRLARDAAAPPGAKGAAVEWGTLLVGVVSSGALTALVTTASSWLGRQRGGSVRVRIGDDELELACEQYEPVWHSPLTPRGRGSEECLRRSRQSRTSSRTGRDPEPTT